MTKENLLEADSHFEFGENWRDYSRLIDGDAIENAKMGVLQLVPESELKGATWLDIGSGSGLHSLAAHLLGASEITAVDIDESSVLTTRDVLEKHGVKARVERMSVFELDGLDTYDIVYSWGVLHHTGDMWRAVRSAAERVKPGGLFAIALYQKTKMCGPWTVEKRIYTAAPESVRKAARGIYMAARVFGLAVKGKNPVKYIKNYKTSRGMNFWHDVHDWMGGYPYESSTPQETSDFVCALGFEPISIGDLGDNVGLLGTGCAEYTFRRKA